VPLYLASLHTILSLHYALATLYSRQTVLSSHYGLIAVVSSHYIPTCSSVSTSAPGKCSVGAKRLKASDSSNTLRDQRSPAWQHKRMRQVVQCMLVTTTVHAACHYSACFVPPFAAISRLYWVCR
jgi:hypothetical protein